MSAGASPGSPPDAGSFFDARASGYDDAYDAPGADGYALRSRMAAVLQLVGAGPGKALDAGMGPGRLAAELSARGWEISGIDAAPSMVSAARSRLPEAARRLVEGKIEALPFADASFDAVVATGVLEYADVERALAELARVVRPGGVAVVSYPNPGTYYGLWKNRVWYPVVAALKAVLGRGRPARPETSRPIRPESFRDRLAAVGLRTEQTVYTSFLVVPSPLDELFPRISESLGRRAEANGRRLGRRVPVQVVYAARRAERG
jgi:ubiquinone/menaquinone biosynthesis C-methylase UbiE